MRLVSFTLGFILLTLISLQSSLASIGQVSLYEGNAAIDRKDGDQGITVEKNLDVFSYDTVKTGNGKVGIEFIDNTRVDVTEHSKLLIDEFVYDPNTKKGKLSLKAKLGTVRYASGQIAKNSATDVLITTPTATIGVRGTDFTMTIDEIGSSTIILLPSCDTNGNCFVGESSVESDAGQVILNQAFQATVVDTVSSKPLTPVLLELDEEMIGNLLIVSKPAAIEQMQNEEGLNEVADALDIDFLQFDDLEVDHLEEDESQFATGLDIDFLEQNFLADILAQINKELAKSMRSEFEKQKSVGDIQLGKNTETGVIILDEDPQWVWIREDASGSYIELRLDKEYGYVLNIIQGEFEQYDFELGGVDNAITIQQIN